MKIGIFGGSFNPPHNMHRDIALGLIDKEYLDFVVYVPTGDNYGKKDLISFSHRINMLELMIKSNDNLLVSDIGNKEDYQYTYQVLDYFRRKYNNSEIYFICGTDNLDDFDTWRKYQYILENYKLLVIKRNCVNVDDILKKYKDYVNNIIIADISEKKLSSTMIRSNICDDDIDRYLDEKVYQYIRKNNIYK